MSVNKEKELRKNNRYICVTRISSPPNGAKITFVESLLIVDRKFAQGCVCVLGVCYGLPHRCHSLKYCFLACHNTGLAAVSQAAKVVVCLQVSWPRVCTMCSAVLGVCSLVCLWEPVFWHAYHYSMLLISYYYPVYVHVIQYGLYYPIGHLPCFLEKFMA